MVSPARALPQPPETAMPSMSPNRRIIRTITATEMRAINRSAILELIRSNGPISRSQIAAELRVSLPTVMRIVDGLQVEGLVKPTGQKEWSGGRRRSLIEFNGAEHLIAGIDLGGTKVYGAVANLNGEILYETRFAHHQSQAEQSFQLLCQVIDDLLQFAGRPGTWETTRPVRGIGIGVPGVMDQEAGAVRFAPSLGWHDFPLRGRLAERFALPAVLENDVNLAALGELCFGVEGAGDNLVLIAIGTGIGAGIVVNGLVYPGAHHLAGEIGYLIPDRSFLDRQYPGFGALEQLASGPGIAERARLLLKDQWPPEQLQALTGEQVFAAARQQAPWAEAVLRETVDYLAQAVASITLVFDPDVILLGGGVSRSADLLIEPILRRLDGVIPALPRLEASRLGYRAGVYGALVQLLRITSNYYRLQKYT
jgi:glucokinase